MTALCETQHGLPDAEGVVQHVAKRRFNIPVEDLKALGVNESDMLDTKREYVPTIRDIDRTECFDKLNNRYVLPTDKLRSWQ